MRLGSPEEVFAFIKDAESAAEPIRYQVALRMGIDGCYYEGVQWINPAYRMGHNRDSAVARLYVDWNPDSRKLRAISNEVTRLTQKQAASTHPDEIYMRAIPPERNTGPDALNFARVHEALANAAVDASGFLKAARLANFRRCVFGTWGVLLALEADEHGGSTLRAFDFDPTCLVTDPYIQKPDLCDHPWVMYSDVWPLDRIKRAFGIEIDPADARTVEQLEPNKVDLAQLSNNRLLSRYARYAKTKAAKVYQLHTREGYRFDKWYLCVEVAPNKKQMVNEESVESPFGAEGLPFTLLHGYARADTMWSWGEPAQLKDLQDKTNLVETLNQRILQNYAGPKWGVDRRAFGSRPSSEDIKRQLSNQVGGVVEYDLSERARNIQPPTLIAMPTPPPFLAEAIDRYASKMREAIHKAPGNFGETPTHVPFRTTERVLDDADQVASVRVSGDTDAYEYLIGVLHATSVAHVQSGNPGTLGILRKAGFQADDFAAVLRTDPDNPGVDLRVQQATVRHRSHQSRKQDLDNAAQLQMIDAEEYRAALADTLQLPLSEEDRQVADQARKAALGVLYGEQRQPRPLGRWAARFIDQFVLAQLDPRAKSDPAALQRLALAIESQYQMQSREALLANPELAAKVAQAGGEPAQAQGNGESAAAGPQVPVSAADVLDALSGGGAGPVAGQPAAAA